MYVRGHVGCAGDHERLSVPQQGVAVGAEGAPGGQQFPIVDPEPRRGLQAIDRGIVGAQCCLNAVKARRQNGFVVTWSEHEAGGEPGPGKLDGHRVNEVAAFVEDLDAAAKVVLGDVVRPLDRHADPGPLAGVVAGHVGMDPEPTYARGGVFDQGPDQRRGHRSSEVGQHPAATSGGAPHPVDLHDRRGDRMLAGVEDRDQRLDGRLARAVGPVLVWELLFVREAIVELPGGLGVEPVAEWIRARHRGVRLFETQARDIDRERLGDPQRLVVRGLADLRRPGGAVATHRHREGRAAQVQPVAASAQIGVELRPGRLGKRRAIGGDQDVESGRVQVSY